MPQQPENITGENWEKKIKGRTGIVYFADYWMRSTDKQKRPTGDHIDLWNGSRMTATGANFFSAFGRRFGLNEFASDASWGYSDVGKSKQILFLEVK